jgi:hypothetical protein
MNDVFGPLTVRSFLGHNSSFYLWFQLSSRCQIWIRPTTGHLCVELTESSFSDKLSLYECRLPSGIIANPFDPPPDPEIIASMPLECYHRICMRYLCQKQIFSNRTNISAKLGAVYYSRGADLEDMAFSCDLMDLMEIACRPQREFLSHGGWVAAHPRSMMNGWTRCAFRPVMFSH